MHSKYVLNELPDGNDATGIANNLRLTTMGTNQFSMETVYLVIIQKSDLPGMRDIVTKTMKMCADRNKHCLRKE